MSHEKKNEPYSIRCGHDRIPVDLARFTDVTILPFHGETESTSIPDVSLKTFIRDGETVPGQEAVMCHAGPLLKKRIDRMLSESHGSQNDRRDGKNLRSIVIVVSDATRPVPTDRLLDPILKIIDEHVNRKEISVKILAATGLHRPSEPKEINRITGGHLPADIQFIDHDAGDSSRLKAISTSDPIELNSHFLEADLRIITGAVEPHFFAGMGGGAKAILPGIASRRTILINHGAKNIDHPRARFGVTDSNPIFQGSRNAARHIIRPGIDYLLNVGLNAEHDIISVAAGDLEPAHDFLINHQRRTLFHRLSRSYDCVICGNGGYPLDLNLYQAVKSFAIGECAVAGTYRGVIIGVNELSEGIGHDSFRRILASYPDPEALLNAARSSDHVNEVDFWQAQILARICTKADVICVTPKLDGIAALKSIRFRGLHFASDLNAALDMAVSILQDRPGNFHRTSEIAVLLLPDGPSLIPISPDCDQYGVFCAESNLVSSSGKKEWTESGR